ECVDDVDGLFPELRPPHHVVTDECGIVHEDVDPALLAPDLIEERLHLVIIAVVDAHGNSVAARGGHLVGGLVDCARKRGIPRSLGAAGDIDGATVTAKRMCDASPGTTAGPGYDDDRLRVR